MVSASRFHALLRTGQRLLPVVLLSVSLAAEAFSSGGYSRPSGGSSSRTPSFGSSSSSRTPSFGGGYSRPSSGGSAAPSYGGSGADRSLSRQSSRDALNAYRQQSAPADVDDRYRRPSSNPSGPWDGWRRPSTRYPAAPPPIDYSPGRWSPPPYAARTRPHYGAVDGLMFWYLLESLSRNGNYDQFRRYRDDQDYRQWRQDAGTLVDDYPELRGKLTELDRRMAEPAPVESSHSGFGTLLLIAVLVLVIYLGWRKLGGDLAKQRTAMSKPSLARSNPSWFRVGMSLPLDPSLFILAQPVTRLQSPTLAGSGSGMVSVEAVGEIGSERAPTLWHRLYLPGRDAFFQVHVDERGRPDECRYFSKIDEVIPGSAQDWGFWLDEREGLIGWSEFQTKDGTLFGRVWGEGSGRMQPMRFLELLRTSRGEQSRQLQAMLYARETGAAAPAPTTEYVLVCAVETDQDATVEIHAGIDWSVSALNLS